MIASVAPPVGEVLRHLEERDSRIDHLLQSLFGDVATEEQGIRGVDLERVRERR